MSFLLLKKIFSLNTKTLTIAYNHNFESCLRILSTFSGFSIFTAGFSLAFGNIAHYYVVLLNAPFSDRDEKTYLPWEILIHRFRKRHQVILIVLASYETHTQKRKKQ